MDMSFKQKSCDRSLENHSDVDDWIPEKEEM